jgi:hypothetical protein
VGHVYILVQALRRELPEEEVPVNDKENTDPVIDGQVAFILADFDQELDDIAHGIWPASEG